MIKLPHKTITHVDLTYEWLPNIYGPKYFDRKLTGCLDDKSFLDNEIIQIEDMMIEKLQNLYWHC